MSYFPDNVDEIRDAINILEKAIAELDGGVSVNVDTLTGTGETGRDVMKAPTPAKARDAIGAGTSSLKLGSTATTAMPGNTPIPGDIPEERLVPVGGGSYSILRLSSGGVPEWAGPLPLSGDGNLLNKGTDTIPRPWSAKVLADYVKSQIAAATAG